MSEERRRGSHSSRSRRSREHENSPPLVSSELEQRVGVTVEELVALYTLEEIKGFGPQKFKELHANGVSPADVIGEPDRLPLAGKRGAEFRNALGKLEPKLDALKARAARQIGEAGRHGALVVTYSHSQYPRTLYESNYPVPILYVRGNPNILLDELAVACVGSRRIREPYAELHRQFCLFASKGQRVIVSGFALGADTIGHRAAVDSAGRTICVMAGGLHSAFPPENRPFWKELLEGNLAVFVSESGFGTPASSLLLRKRNKLIAALAKGVLVSQSSRSGGAMNAYRFAKEQKKMVATFQDDGTEATSGNALVAEELKDGDAVFPAEPHSELWSQWLRKLSSSTSTELY